MFKRLARLSLSATLLATLLVGVPLSPAHSASQDCSIGTRSDGSDCQVGDTGPGGGTVYYAPGSTFTSTGSGCGSECKYLEVAPLTWAGYSSEESDPWTQVSGGYFANITNSALGAGHENTTAIASREAAKNTAAETSRAYRGGSKTDWSLPSTNELMLLCQWSKGLAQNPTGSCSSATITKGSFVGGSYWTSNEVNTYKAVTIDFSTGSIGNGTKGWAGYTRPIRAFGIFKLSTAPSISAITTRTKKLTVNFAIPVADGGMPVTKYQYSTDGGVTFRDRTEGTLASPLIITKLSLDGTTDITDGLSYSIKIKAFTSMGESPVSTGVSATPNLGLGDTGPGGGTVFYYSATPFTCGPTLNLSCKYLEVAPNSTWADQTLNWSGNTATFIGTTSLAIGSGYSNSLAIITQDSTAGKAATKARAYTGGGKTDWYLPSRGELAVLDTNQSFVPSLLAAQYFSSSESSDVYAWAYTLFSHFALQNNKTSSLQVRPIRAFDPTLIAQTTLTISAASGIYGTATKLVTTGGSGAGTVTFSTVTPSCSITIDSLTVTTATTCVVTATKAADATYAIASASSINVAFSKAVPTVGITFPGGASTVATYRTLITITLSATVPGKIGLKVGGVWVPGCKNLAISSTKTCLFKPSSRGSVELVMFFTPTSSSDYSSVISIPTYLAVGPRSGRR